MRPTRYITLGFIGCATAAAAASSVSVSVEQNPTPAETAAIKRALGSDYSDMAPFAVARADLNSDGKRDLIFRSQNSDYCGSAGCATAALLSTRSGYSSKQIDLAYSGGAVIVLAATHKGMRDLRYEGGTHTFIWSGTAYK